MHKTTTSRLSTRSKKARLPRPSAIALAAALAALSAAPAHAASCTWNPASGNWAAAVNWLTCATGNGSPAGTPGTSDTANVGAGKVVTVNTAQSAGSLSNAGQINIDAFLLNLGSGGTLNTGVINVGGPSTAALQLSGSLGNAGGTVNVGNGSVFNQFGQTITGGTINTTGTGKLVANNSNGNILSGLTLNGLLDLATGTGIQRVTGGLALNGGVNINQNSVLSFAGNQTLSGNGTVVLGSTGSSNRALSLEGDTVLTLGSNIVVRGENGTLGQAYAASGTQSIVNNGRISADVSGGTIFLAPTQGTTNNGVLEAQNGGTLILNSTVTGNAGSSIVAGIGSTVLQNGVALSGVINTSGSGDFRAANSNSNFLNSATLNGTLNLATATGIERVTGGLVLNGGVNINNNSVLSFGGDQTLSGNGTIVLGSTGSSNRALSLEGDTVLTLGSNIVVRGENGTLGQTYAASGTQRLVNNGRISADVSGGTIFLAPTQGTTNNGVLEAQNGGTLVLNSAVTGNVGSSIVAGAGSTVLQNGVALSGVINTSGSGDFRAANSMSNFLNSVTLNGTLNLATATGIERVNGGLVLNGGVNINQNSVLSFAGNQTLSGNGTIVLGSTGSSNRALSLEGDTVLTLGSNIVVRGENGTLGQAFAASGTQRLVNNGRISADVSGGTIYLAPTQGTTNNGVLEAQNGGTLVLNSAVTGNVGSSIVAGAGSTVVQNGVTLSGVINASGTGNFRAANSNANFLDGVTFSGPLDMASATSIERVTNGLVLNGTVNVNNNSVLSFAGSQSLVGSGTIVLGNTGGSNRALSLEGNTVLTVGSDIVVRGQNGTVGQVYSSAGTQSIVNNGVIRADVAGGLIDLSAGQTSNGGTLGASNGGTLRMNNAVTQVGSGQISVANGSSVIQNGMTVTGGTINTAGTGVFVASNSNANFLSGVTLAGTLDMASATGIERVQNGLTLSSGTVKVNSNSVLSFSGTQTLGGNGTIELGSTGVSNRALSMEGNLDLTIGQNVLIRGTSGTIGEAYAASGTQNLINNGRIVSDGGGSITVTPTALVNNGTLRAQNGALVIQAPLSGAGTLQVDSTGSMTLANGAKSQGQLIMGAPGASLNIGSGDLTVSGGYTNAAAGAGNSFDRRAGITGTGQIVAGGVPIQTITGANVSNGTTANATLTLGNVRVGATTVTYQVANTGTGPTMSGAIQTLVNGANLSDSRLSGTGVTAGNYNVGGPGSLGVTFTASTAGALAPLSGQVLNLRSNFENIADQKLNIVLANGAAAYNSAVGQATAPVVVANQRIGGSLTANVNVLNAAAPGSFSEDLHASVGGATSGVSASGSINGRVAGTNSGGGNISVGVDTTSAGAKGGTVTLNYQTAGTVGGVGNGLAAASAGNQTVAVSGNVYQTAAGALQTTAFNFGTLQVGQSISQALVVRNTATGPTGFVEDLNASFGAAGNSQISGAGALNGIRAGNNSAGANGSMVVTVTGSTAGALNSAIGVNYFSAGAVNGVSNGLGVLGVGSENFAVNGTISAVANVINQASPSIGNTSINLGAVRVGAAAPSATVSLSNVATTAPQAALNASIATSDGPFVAGGSVSLLAPGATDNGSLTVGMGTATAGSFAGVATLGLVSDAANVGGCGTSCQMSLGSQTVSLTGKVYAPAVAQLGTSALNFGIVHVGDVVAGKALTVTNAAAVAGLNDTLKGSMGSTTGGAFSGSGNLGAGLAAGATDNGSLVVALDTSAAGSFIGQATVGFASHNADMSDADLGNQTVQLSAQVNNYAELGLSKASGNGAFSASGNTYTLDFGNIVLGGADSFAELVLSNTAVGPADLLKGLFDFLPTGAFTLNGFGAFADLAAGDSIGGYGISFDSATLGSFSQTITIHAAGTNASGYEGLLADTTLVLTGNVVAVQAVPEPETYAMLALGLVAVGFAKRRRDRLARDASKGALA